MADAHSGGGDDLEVIARYVTAGGSMDEENVRKVLRSAVAEGEQAMKTWIDNYIEQGL